MENIIRAAGAKRGRRLSGRRLVLLIFYVCLVAGAAIYNASNDDNAEYNITPVLNSLDSAKDHILKTKILQTKPGDTATFYGHDAIPPQQDLPTRDSQIKNTNTPKHK